jgi:hypothetical protein
MIRAMRAPLLATLLALPACLADAPPPPVEPPAAPAPVAAASATEAPHAPLLVAGPAPDEPRPAAIAAPPPDDGLVLTRGCGASRVPRERRGGDLVVATPAPAVPEMDGGRLRTDTRGSLSKGSLRRWAGRAVPAFVPLTLGTRELFVLDDVDGGLLALWRDPYGASSCDLASGRNCDFEVRLFDCAGALRGRVAPSDHWSRPDRLELQDVRYEGGVVYWNEACQSYSREAGGQCSRLVAYDLAAARVRWKSAPLRSNGWFLVHGRYVVTAYGFTAEPDAIFVLRREDGATVSRTPVTTMAQKLEIAGEVLVATTYPGTRRAFRMVGFDGPSPRLVPARAPVERTR